MLVNMDNALQFYQNGCKGLRNLDNLRPMRMHRVAYAYWLVDLKEEAKYYFDKQLEYDNRMNELGRSMAESKVTYYDLGMRLCI